MDELSRKLPSRECRSGLAMTLDVCGNLFKEIDKLELAAFN